MEFSCKATLAVHKSNAHSDLISCNDRSQSNHSENNLEQHLPLLDEESQDPYDSILWCRRCDYSTQFEDNLKEHFQSTHVTGTRYFYSKRRNVPEKPFARKTNDRKIEDVSKVETKLPKEAFPKYVSSQSNHKTNGALMCDVCDKSFLHKDELQLHKDFYHDSQ